MTATANRALIWAPRALCAAFAIFIGLFALDAFEPGRSLTDNLIAFAIHLRPSLVILALLAIGWRWPKFAGALLIAAGFWYAFMPGPRNHLSWIVVVAGPAWLCGVLFLLSGWRPSAR